MQTIHYVLAGVVALLGIGLYVFQAGKWAATREHLDKKVDELKLRFDAHEKSSDKRHIELAKKVEVHDERIARVESDRRIVVFPRARRRREDFGDDDQET